MARDGWVGGWGRRGGRVTVSSTDGRPVPAHLGQGARKATRTLRHWRHARISSRAASHARAVASSPAGYWCCGGDPGAGNTAYQTAYTLGIEASTAPVVACRSGGVARDLSPRERHRTVPSWVTPTLWPPEPSSSLSHPSIRSTWRWGALVQACGVAAPPRRTGRGPKSQRGASRGATRAGCVPSLLWRRGDRHSAAAAPYRQPRASWSAGPDTATPWGTRCRAESPHLRSAPVAVQWKKYPMRMSSRLRRLGGRSPRACSAQATLARDCSVRGRRGGGGAALGSHGQARGVGLAPGHTAPSRRRPRTGWAVAGCSRFPAAA